MFVNADTSDGSVVTARTALRRVDVTGGDRIGYLEDVTSQHFADAEIGTLLGALVLDPHGVAQAMLDVVVLGDRLVLLVVDDDAAATVLDVLGGRTFLRDAVFTATDDVALRVIGPGATSMTAGIGLGHVEGRCRLVEDVLVVPRVDGLDIIGPGPTIDDIAIALTEQGAEEGGPEDVERARVRAGVPAWGREVRAPHLPEEAGVLPTHVHLGKGCYPGQEAVARMWMLGRPRRRLAHLRILAGAVEAGWHTGDGKQRLDVTSVEPQDGWALGYVPADTAPGDELGDGPVRLEVARIIGDDANPPGHDPAMRRRRDRAATPQR